MNNLVKLYLESNKIIELPAIFNYGLKSLEDLNLSYNYIPSLSKNFGNEMKNLWSLNLCHNKLNSLPRVFENEFANLIHLDLSFNHLTSLPKKFGMKMKKIYSLKLNNNRLSFLPENFGSSWENLTTLDLSHNKISKLNQSFFSDLKSIQILKLDHNDLIELPDDFGDSMHLIREINLSYNDLRCLPECFRNLAPSLLELDISNNPHFHLKGKKGVSLGLDDLKEIFKNRLKYNIVIRSKADLVRFYDRIPFRWNLEKFKLFNNSIVEITKNQLSYKDFERIIKKFENFKISKATDEGNFSDNFTTYFDLFKTTLQKLKATLTGHNTVEDGINLYKNIENIELDLDDHNPDRNQLISYEEFPIMLTDYIKKLFNPENDYRRWAMPSSYSGITLDFLGGIFEFLDKQDNATIIQSHLLIILSALTRCSLRQFEEFERLYLQIKGEVYKKNSIEDFFNYHISAKKEKVFEKMFLYHGGNLNVHKIDYWHAFLETELGLVKRNTKYDIGGVLRREIKSDNGFFICYEFLNIMRPREIIEYLVDVLNKESKSDKRLLNEIIQDIILNLGDNQEDLFKLGINELNYIYPSEATYDLVKKYLIIKEILIENEPESQ